MRILLCKPRGFCAGVNMAINALKEAIVRFGVPIYVYHEIVHNTWVVDDFRNSGVIFVDTLDAIPSGSRMMISAHGAAPEILRLAQERHIHTIDATCPLVRKVHEEVIRFAKQGCRILLVGHPGHDEVVAVMGEAPDAIEIIASEEDVDRLSFRQKDKSSPFEDSGLEHVALERVAYVMQTTLSVDFAQIIERKLKERFPQIIGPERGDICYATQNRQDAVKILAPQADWVFVVGSRNSSNSKRLAEIAELQERPSKLIDGPDDIPWDRFHGTETILITAGASAPESVVQQCVELLARKFDATVEEITVRDESLQFALPKELR